MYTFFYINRSNKNRAVYNFKNLFNIPILNIRIAQKFTGRLYTSELIIPNNISDEKYYTLLYKSYKKLYHEGIRKIALPETVNPKAAINAGLIPQDLVPVFSAKAYDMLIQTLDFIKKDINDVLCIVYSEKLTKNAANLIYSLINQSRYLYVDCGRDTDALSCSILQQYGISIQQSIYERASKDIVLVLFSKITKEYLQYLRPNVIINICGQEIRDASNMFVISGATINVGNNILNELPTGINKQAAAALLIENGWLSPSAINLSNIRSEYFF